MFDARLSRYFNKYRGRYILGGVLLIAASLVTMIPPAIIARTIDGFREGTTTGMLATYGGMIIATCYLLGVALSLVIRRERRRD